MYTLLLLNGGIGARVGANQPKQLIKVRGIPMLVYSLVAADAIDSIDQIVLNYPAEWLEDIKSIVSSYAIKTPIVLVEAGDTRHASVAAMLPHAKNHNVIIHESARPLATQKDFQRLIAQPEENVSFMLPISFTVAPVNPETREVTGFLERDKLRNVQLPQKFNKLHLQAAHDNAESKGLVFTEDATLVATSGYPVFFLEGSESNIKVTTPLDVTIATIFLQKEDGDE